MHLDDFRWMARTNRDKAGWSALEASMPEGSFSQLTVGAVLDRDESGAAEAQIKQARAKYFLSVLPEQISSLVEQGEWLRYPNEYGRVIYVFYGAASPDPDKLAPDGMSVELFETDAAQGRNRSGKFEITHGGIELWIRSEPHHQDPEKRLQLSFIHGPHGSNNRDEIYPLIAAMKLPSEVIEFVLPVN